MKTKGLKLIVQFFLVVFCFSFFQVLFLLRPKKLNSANLTSASATLSNSRLSYKSSIATTQSAGDTTITIDTDSADGNTNHLFPGDSICFVNSAESGCIGNRTYSVGKIVDSTNFTITDDLDDSLADTDFVVATQSGTLTIAFTTTGTTPSDGDILITIPSVDTDNKTNDSIPDTNSAVSTNGFDIGSVAAGDISTTGCTDANWVTSETITAGGASADTTIRIDRQTAVCAASSTITATVGSTNYPINPAPITTGHTQGTADIYTINVKTRDGSDNTIDEVDIRVAPVEAVLVSATVEETLSFTVAGLSSGNTYCNQTTDVTTTAYSIPWGTLSSTDTFYEAAQQLTTSTNADGGYTVKIEENDQMGKDGATCTGASADESNNCIKDTLCASTPCSESSTADWTTAATYHGLGYSLEDFDGTDAAFEYNDGAATFLAKQIADMEASETRQTIMSNTGPVSSKDIYVCYRIAVSSTQPAGYYYNKVKYTATATF